ncbi:MAG: hypothetical protein DMG21_13805 [Acidobacteria bacterium]|nr:MAG: hypothetical protein DMG21_13805 [Acidobacteriota bacterium]
MKKSLAWLYARALPPVSNWQGNARNPAAANSNQGFEECGIVSTVDLAAGAGATGKYAETAVENIVFDAPSGILPDAQAGPDGFPINYSPIGLPQGNLFVNFIANPSSLTVTGRCFNLLQLAEQSENITDQNGNPLTAKVLTYYRVDVFAKTDIFYYKGSAKLVDSGLGYAAWWLPSVTSAGTLIAALYPASVAQPAGGSHGTTLPAGWISHTNTGVGAKLTNYKAQIFSKTDVEYLQEDNVPIIVQDPCHARIGSSVVPAAGTVSMQILYNDPVAGWISEFDLLQTLAAYPGLPRSEVVPTSDPKYVSNLTTTNEAALQNRAWTYSTGLALIAYALSGNFTAAKKIIEQWVGFIANPGYLPSVSLENAEDGLASRWSKSDPSSSIANVAANSMSPQEPPNGTGQVIEFTSHTSGDSFSFIGAGLPDSTDTNLQFEHLEPAGAAFGFVYTIGVTTAAAKVTSVQVSSGAEGPATYNSGIKTITLPIGTNPGGWIVTQVPLASLISSLAADTLSSITSFTATLNYVGNAWFDNLTVGTLQPTGSLAFSYDVYYGEIADVYIRTGANAWAAFAWAIYMAAAQDYSSVLSLQNLLTFLLTQQSADADLRNGLFYLGYGKYVNPGYQFVPGQIKSCSGEHQIDVYFAFERAIAVLPTAIIQARKQGTITEAQAESLSLLVGSLESTAATLGANFQTVFYTAPTGSGWAANTNYDLGFQIQDSNGNQQKCVAAGTSSSDTPGWATTYGDTTADNTATWQLTALAGQPGHCCQGVNASGTSLDVSESVDSNGAWAAHLLDALGNDTAAVECLKWAYQTFYITNQNIQLSAVSNSWNEAYQQQAPFSGVKFYNDSSNGYSGSPASVSMEQTWGLISGLLRLYSNSLLQAYFNSVFGGAGTQGLDSFLKTLVSDQFTVFSTTNDGAFLAYSLAARDLPWEFTVFETIAATAWMWITAMNPTVLLSALTETQVLPCLIVPKGQNQTVSEKDGSTSIGQFQVEAIDPGSLIKGALANPSTIGLTARLRMLFPEQSLGDAVALHTVRIAETGFTAEGKLTISCQDGQAFIAQGLIWNYGGPSPWVPGELEASQPSVAAYSPNAFPISDTNPRWLQGNPLDLLLVALQNELGVGQDLALPPVLVTAAANKSASQMGLGFVPNPSWQVYRIGDDSTLINPNSFLDVSSILQLRDTEFSGYWFEIKLTSPAQAKQWLEDQLLKPLGLFFVTRADGRLSLKAMKAPAVPQGVSLASYGAAPWWKPWPASNGLPIPAQLPTGVMAFNETNIMGLPSAERLELTNAVTVRMDQADSVAQTSARAYETGVTFVNENSLQAYRIFAQHTVESYGLKSARGGILIAELLARRIFERHAFRAPVYTLKAMLASVIVEVGDYVWLSHSKVPDLLTGGVGITSVLCEVLDRQPDYASAKMEFKLLDTRPLQIGQPYQVAPASAGVPAFGSATAAEKSQYMYIASAASGGLNTDGTAGNAIF